MSASQWPGILIPAALLGACGIAVAVVLSGDDETGGPEVTQADLVALERRLTRRIEALQDQLAVVQVAPMRVEEVPTTPPRSDPAVSTFESGFVRVSTAEEIEETETEDELRQRYLHPLSTVLAWLQEKDPEKYEALMETDVLDLSELDLDGVGLTDEDLASLLGLGDIQWLNLAGNHVTDAGLAVLSSMHGLEALNLSGNAITGAGLRSLHAPSLKSLWLRHTQIGDDDLASLAHMTSLQKVNLDRLDITDRGLDSLGGCRSLRHIEIDGTDVTEGGVAHLLSLNPDLTRLEIRDNGISEEFARRMATQYPRCEIVIAQGAGPVQPY